MLTTLHEWLEHMSRPESCHAPYWFDRVTVSGRPDGERRSQPLFSLLAPVRSEYESGPSLLELAAVAGHILGPGYYGLESCRPLGFKWDRAPERIEAGAGAGGCSGAG